MADAAPAAEAAAAAAATQQATPSTPVPPLYPFTILTWTRRRIHLVAWLDSRFCHLLLAADKIPMKRCCELQEVADVICFAASKACSFTTGFTFDVTGGRATY
mmetsp:Transcript_31630/g.82693  ORF Transcript_31630/g.82693 Transcript_31630/m.82693 type:complete len:103 (-) Transcript_31630:484-792(-)